jgi:hypothetical protein
MNSPLELHEVRLRGLHGQAACGERPFAMEQLKPHAVCGAFRSRCGGFSRSVAMPAPTGINRPFAGLAVNRRTAVRRLHTFAHGRRR